METVNGKVVGRIVERGRGFSSWIKFGVKILARLLEGVEECHVGKTKGPFRRVWSEGGRGYSLMLRSNKVGRFLLCSAVCIEEKRSSLVFPERNAAHGGWKILASKLRSGVAPELRPEEELKELMRLWVEKEKRGRELPKFVSYAEMLERDKSFVGDEVWIESEVEEVSNKLDSLRKCLVG